MASKSITSIPTECPACGGKVWDNTTKPKRTPKAPDAACRDKEGCGWAGWLHKQATPAGAAGKPSGRTAYTWAELGNTYAKCAGIARKVWTGPDQTALVAATATLFIQAVQNGMKAETAKPAPTPPPPPMPEADNAHPGWDEELPF